MMIQVYPLAVAPSSYLSPASNTYVMGMEVKVEKQQFEDYRKEGHLIWKTMGLMTMKVGMLIMAAPAQALTGATLTDAYKVLDPAFSPSTTDFPVADRITANDNDGWELAAVNTERDADTKDGIYETHWIVRTKYTIQPGSLKRIVVNQQDAGVTEVQA